MENITSTSTIVLCQGFKTPYNHFYPGDSANVEYWANKLGKPVETFIQDLKNGSLEDWFRQYN